MRSALDSLAVAVPEWLTAHIQPDWFDRYGRRVENYRLPKLDSEREALGSTIGAAKRSLHLTFGTSRYSSPIFTIG